MSDDAQMQELLAHARLVEKLKAENEQLRAVVEDLRAVLLGDKPIERERVQRAFDALILTFDERERRAAAPEGDDDPSGVVPTRDRVHRGGDVHAGGPEEIADEDDPTNWAFDWPSRDRPAGIAPKDVDDH